MEQAYVSSETPPGTAVGWAFRLAEVLKLRLRFQPQRFNSAHGYD